MNPRKREIRRFEISDMLEEIYSALSVHIPVKKRQECARLIISKGEALDIDADDYLTMSDLVSDAELPQKAEVEV